MFLHSDKKIEFGQRGTLPCSATGIPEPEISWRRLNGNESIGSGSRVLSNGALTIERMDPKDAGVYECIAENAFGSATMRVSIDVYGLGITHDYEDNSAITITYGIYSAS